MKIKYIEIYEQLVKHYPFGISPSDPIFNEYSGSVLLQDKCYEKLQSPAYNKWESLVKGIKDENTGILNSDHESPLVYPCYSGVLTLHKQKKNELYFTRELTFHLSLVAPYFTIYGLDRVTLISDSGQRTEFGPLLYASPIDIYGPYFDLVRKKIENSYDTYAFIPYSLLARRINSLKIFEASNKDNQFASVFQALFTFDDVTDYKYKGDIWYE